MFLDIKSAFSHGDLAETIYITQPEGFIDVRNTPRNTLFYDSIRYRPSITNTLFWNILEHSISNHMEGDGTEWKLSLYYIYRRLSLT